MKYFKASKEYTKSFQKRSVLLNTFWGLEKAVPLTPNYTVTGPLFKPHGDLLADLEKKDPELLAWLNKAEADGIDVVYVSIGSECHWQQWSIDAIYEGLKKLGVRCVWSIRNNDLNIPDSDPNFWIKEWLPQIEALSHPAIKAGITHCGFGGTLEFISMNVIPVTWPHFGDQIYNSKSLVESGAAVLLKTDEMRMWEASIAKVNSWKDPVFDSQKVHDTFKEALTNTKYR